MILSPYLTYIKIGAAALLLAVFGGTCWHLGGLGPKTHLAQLQAKQAEDESKRDDMVTSAVLAERARAQAEKDRDHKTEQTHANELDDIDRTPPRTDPVVVRDRATPASPVCVGAVSGAKGKADSVAASATEGGSQPVDRGRDIRPAIEEVKKRLEKVMADYRQEDTEWPK